uniref:Lian-aa1 retrotransposon protein n=1 Tax=Triatoma infestans TaxID=30076 RepID=A0A161MM06_TRIIF
MDSSLGIVV